MNREGPSPRRGRSIQFGTALSIGLVLALLSTVATSLPVAASRPAGPAPASAIVLQGGFSNFVMDPFRDRLYVADSSGGRIIVWDTSTDHVVANVTVDGNPYGMDVSADGSQLYVALTTALAVGVVDLNTLTSLGRIHLSASPVDVAAGRPGRAYVTVSGQWTYPLVLDTDNRVEIGNITQAGGIYGGGVARTTRDRTTLFVTSRGLSPEDLYKFSITSDPVKLVSVAPFDLVGANLGDADLSIDGRLLFVACGGPSGAGYYVQGLSTEDWRTTHTLYTGPYPNSVSLDQRGWIAFTAHSDTDVIAFNTTNSTRVGTFVFSQEVRHVRTVPDGTKIYALTVGAGARLEVATTGFPPTPSEPPLVRMTANATTGYAPLSVAFGAAALLGSPPFNYTWDFGDGGTSDVAYPHHVYAEGGTFVASVSVRDRGGYQVSDALTITATPAPAPSPLRVGRQFAGVGFGPENFWVPPDPQVAAGPDHLVEMVNARVLMTTKDGRHLLDETMEEFFHVDQFEYLSDPKVQFDALSHRWFASVFDLIQGSVLLAVSSDVDPTKPWDVQSYLSARGCPDQPLLGVAAHVVIVSVNAYSSCQASGTYEGMEYWVVNKTGLIENSSNDFVHLGPDLDLFSVHPAQAFQPSAAAYMVSVGDGTSLSSSLTLFTLTGVPPAPVDVAMSSLPIRPFIEPPNAAQAATRFLLDTSDSRVQDAFVDGNSLWLTFGSACPAVVSGSTRSCARIIQIDLAAGSVRQDFDVFDLNREFFYPAIRTDSSGDLMIVFATSSASEYPGIMASAQLVGDPVNSFRQPIFLRRGGGAETTGCPDGSTCRYGDYFGAARDPTDPSLIWVVGEYGGFLGWQTAISGVGAFPSVQLTFSYLIEGGGTAYLPPQLTSFSSGVKTVQPLHAERTAVDLDRDSVWSVPAVLSGSNESERWMTDMATSGRASEATAMDFVYRHQYWLNVQSAHPTGGTVSPATGWQDAGKTVTLRAMAVDGWQFAGWEGIGSTSYTGSSNPLPLAIDGAVNETARFDAGLMITVNGAGSVAYSFANVTGSVAGGTSRTIYVPPGTDVHLEASPGGFGRFVAWSGGVSGPGTIAVLRIDAPETATATFASDVSAAALPLGAGTSILVLAVVSAFLVLRRRRRRARPPIPPGDPR